jgi:hypothetical protein
MIRYYYEDTVVKDPTQYLEFHYGLTKKTISEISNNVTLVGTVLTVVNLKSRLEWIESIYIKNSILIVDCSTEAIPLQVLNILDDWCKKKDIRYVVITSALNTNRRVANEIFHPMFFKYKPITQIDILNRTKKYTCFARLINGREHRLLLIQELYRLGLLEKGVITCGSGNTDKELDEYKSNTLLDREFQKLLPIRIENKLANRYESSNFNLENIELSQFNLILESSYEHFSSEETNLRYCHGWTRLFFTEKSAKCINSFQIPIWVAPKGFVQQMRELKFDVFDDIVNHSYDNIENPEFRLKAVANEVKRLCNTPLNNPELNKRLYNNTVVLKTLEETFKEQFIKNITDILITS